MHKLVTSKEQILTNYPDVFKGIGRFPESPYHIQIDPNILLSKLHADQYLSI